VDIFDLVERGLKRDTKYKIVERIGESPSGVKNWNLYSMKRKWVMTKA